jgi:hypothetical protein
MQTFMYVVWSESIDIEFKFQVNRLDQETVDLNVVAKD